ncbi:MAG TPA: ComEC/Rec2 family competence protein [Conexibacter sp.]|nr:ComEC/Rec2 family competence protein [Conexibacter sp.]
MSGLDALRAHPRHLVLAALVAGLLAAPLAPRLVLLCALTAAALGGRPTLALLAAGAALAGALGGQARLAALDRTQLPPLFGATVVARVVLLEQPRPVRYGHTALVQLRSLVRAGGTPADSTSEPAAGIGERVMLRIGRRAAWSAAPTGALMEVRGRLRALGPFERHYARRGAHAAISLDGATATGAARGGPMGLVDGIRTRAERALSAGLPAPQAALLRGMTLGQDEALDERTRKEFRVSSLAHVLAASGQNVALLLALALPLLAWAGLGLRGRLLGALALIALYVPLAGAGPSIQRAGAMGAATTVAALAGRPASRWYALLLAAAATLALNPRASGDPGWQLSFAAVVAIALLAPGVRGTLRGRRVPAPVADATAMSLAATLGTAPLLAFHFAQLSLVGLPANLLAAPAIAPITWLGMLAGALGQLAPALALPLNALNAYLLAYVGWVAHVAASVPHASVALALPGPLRLVASYAGIGLAALLARWLLRRRPRT